MTVAVIKYSPGSGKILNLRHEVDHEYEPKNNELIVDDETYHDPAALEGKRIDTEADPPEIVDAENKSLADEFREAREDDDIQTQLDVLFELITGDKP